MRAISCFTGFRAFPALVNRAAAVAHNHVLQTERNEQADDRDAGGSGAAGDNLDLVQLPARELERVQHGGKRNDGRAVLVVVEDRDIAAGLEALLNFKAARGGNIFEVDAAEAARNQANGIDDVVHVLGADADRNRVHAAEALEQRAFSLHDRHAGLRADVAEAEHRGAVRYHGHEIRTAGQVVALVHVLLDLQAGLRNARRIG